jgi:hypothetical protein
MQAIIAAVLPVLIKLLEKDPQLAGYVKEAWGALTARDQPTAEQQAQMDAALEAAHKALQES